MRSAAPARERLPRLPLVRSRIGGWLCLLLGLLLAVSVIMAPLEAEEQVWLALGGVALFFVANRFRGRTATIMLAALSGIVSLRYLYWRLTATLEYDGFLQAVLGTGLLLAELYAIIALVLAYFQTLWPLQRKPVPLPADPADWPVVDVFIPTYNESLEVVKPTVLAAMALDWPREKLNVYLLDDGRREEFRRFAEAVGAIHLIRPDNKGAKAGNINHALTKTKGEYIAIFDCDHVPTRAFLQLTLGWLLRDRRLAMVQTPHHFYSPDPFERNLAAGARVPNEGLLFYGLVQPGNDLWDATFFCGSCAVIRRAALEEVGGVPTETVTEDCHCSLKMQRRGWGTAYLRVPLAAGLATERLMIHIGQRMRWARGMVQILRVENPLTASGLKWHQRFCYFMGMFHYLFPLPRVVFLTSPLSYLLFGQNVIAASPLAIAAYAGPHIIHSILTGSRIQGGVRHSWWSEIYEAVLALYLVPVTLATLWNPRKGKFNVTDKGGMLAEGYLDMRAVGPSMVLALLLIAGLLVGIHGAAVNPSDSLEFQAYTLNVIWASLCLVTIMAGLAVGRERRQVRERARIHASIPARIILPDGRGIAAETRDLSLGGAQVEAALPEGLPEGAAVILEVETGADRIPLPGTVLRWSDGRLQLRFAPRDLREEGQLVRAVFGRADAWVDWDAIRADRPLRSFRDVLESITGLFRGASQLRPGRRRARAAGAVARKAAALLLVAGFGLSGTALAQPRQAMPAAPLAPPAAMPPPAPLAAAPEVARNTRRVTFTLRQLGLRAPMRLHGTTDLQGVLFGVRGDEVVTDARLTLRGATSPALIRELSQIAITLNEQFVGAIQPDRDRPNFGPLEFRVNPVFFADSNRLNFRFSGRYAVECNDPLSGLLWATIDDQSSLQLLLERLPLAPDLARLPEPFFDSRLVRLALTLPVVLPDAATPDAVRAAVIATSWFAVQADYRGASFPVSAALPARGHGLVIAVGADAVPGLTLPRFDGPTLALVPNPADPDGLLLVIGGRTAAEAVTAATVLAAGREALSGELALVQAPSLPPRQPYDAPRWIRADRPVRLGELMDPSELQVAGYSPGPISVPFRTAPDLYTWRNGPVQAEIRYRAPPGPVTDVATSRLDVLVNDIYLKSLPLRGAEPSWPFSWIMRQIGVPERSEGRVGIPTWSIFGQNELQLRYDMQPLARGDCVAVPGEIRAGIDPDSTIDLSSAYRFTTLPNLAFFVGSGFPFTRLADLSGSAAVIPDRPAPAELSAFLGLIGRMAALVGQPATGLRVVRPQDLPQVADRDLIVIGALGHQPALQTLLRDAPLQAEGNRFSLALPDALGRFRHLFDGERRGAVERVSATLAAPGEGLGALLGFESPLRAGGSVLVLTGSSPAGMEAMVAALHDPEQLPHVQGDLALLSGGRMQSFRLGGSYTHGTLPPWLWPQYWMGGAPFRILSVMALAMLLIAAPLYWVLRRRAARRLRERTN